MYNDNITIVHHSILKLKQCVSLNMDFDACWASCLGNNGLLPNLVDSSKDAIQCIFKSFSKFTQS